MKIFSKTELALWAASVAAILASLAVFGGGGVLTAAASVIGVTSLMLNAKANPAGQALMVVFSLLYGYISYGSRYYGEMMTYLGMTAPMAAAALVSWLRHPSSRGRSETAVGEVGGREAAFMLLLTAAVTALFGYVLALLGTRYLPLSTLSVATSFAAVYLTARRSPFFALVYAMNDVVLIVLWSLAAADERSCVSVVVCFAAFLCGDVYGFVNWRRIKKRQAEERP